MITRRYTFIWDIINTIADHKIQKKKQQIQNFVLITKNIKLRIIANQFNKFV